MTYVGQAIVQEAAEDLIAFVIESTNRRDEEIKARLRRITAMTEMQRKATRKNGTAEIARQGDLKAR
jgi:hypothetical protein